MAVLAGFWGPEAIFWSTSGTPARDVKVTVLDATTLTPTTLYVDETKAQAATNPVLTDERGNLSFFAVPGEYYLRWDGALEDTYVVVGVHPADPSGGGGGSVVSVDGRVGIVTLGDLYTDPTELAAGLAGKASSSHTHVSSQITDFNSAVDSRVQNIVGAAPAALDTLDELAQALGDDANFAGTVTTALAGKQPIDADLTAIAGLAPADGSVLARVAGAWSSRTGAQLKTDLALTKSDVGLANADNTSDVNKPISAAAQTALNSKAATSYVTDPMLKYGILASPGRFEGFQGNGGYANQWIIVRCFVPPNVGPLTRMTIPVKSASAGYASNGKPNQLAWWTDAGTFQSATPDDSTMWNTVDWYVATLSSPVPNFTVGTWIYGGFQINGQTGGGQFVVTSASDAGNIPYSHAPGSSQRFSAYGGSVASLTDFNTSTFGTLTSFTPFLGFLA